MNFKIPWKQKYGVPARPSSFGIFCRGCLQLIRRGPKRIPTMHSSIELQSLLPIGEYNRINEQLDEAGSTLSGSSDTSTPGSGTSGISNNPPGCSHVPTLHEPGHNLTLHPNEKQLQLLESCREDLERIQDEISSYKTNHSDWVRVMQKYILELRSSHPSRDDTSVSSSSTEHTIISWEDYLEEFFGALWKGAIECIIWLSTMFNMSRSLWSRTERLFSSGEILMESSWLLLEYGERYVGGSSQLHSKIEFPGGLLKAMEGLRSSSTELTAHLQSHLLQPENLCEKKDTPDNSIHELSRAIDILLTAWTKGVDLANTMRLDDGQGHIDVLHRHKTEGVCQILTILTKAADQATGMQVSFQDQNNILPSLDQRKGHGTTLAAGEVTNEVVLFHLWLFPCVQKLFECAEKSSEHLRSCIMQDERSLAILKTMRFALYELSFVTTERIVWLLTHHMHLRGWALKSLEAQGKKLQSLIKEHQQMLGETEREFSGSSKEMNVNVGHLQTILQRLKSAIHASRYACREVVTRNPEQNLCEDSSGFPLQSSSSQPRHGILAQSFRGREIVTIKRHLGSGSTGDVFAAQYFGASVAVKLASSKSLTAPRELESECCILSQLAHPNIVRYLGYVPRFQPENGCPLPAMVTEFCTGGNLFDLITDAREFRGKTLHNQRTSRSLLFYQSWNKRLHIAGGVANGLCYLHAANLIHGDLTSYNVIIELFENEWEAKICDFGNSRRVNDDNKDANQGAFVSPAWSAPEVQTKGTSKQSDTYSFGVIFREIVTLEPPYKHWLPNGQIYYNRLPDDEPLRLPDSLDPNQSQIKGWGQLKVLIERCWSSDESKRPDMDTISDALQNCLRNLEER